MAIRSRQKLISSYSIRRAPAFLTIDAFTASPETGSGIQSPQPLLCLHASRKLPRLRAAKWILISAKAAGKLRADLFVLRPRLCLFVPEPEQNIHLPLSKKNAIGLRNGCAFLSMFRSGRL